MGKKTAMSKTLGLFRDYSTGYVDGEVYHADAFIFLQSLPDESANLVFLDPPFNLGKIYGGSNALDLRAEPAYERWIKKILREAVRILKPGGALYLYHLPRWAMRFGFFLEKHLVFQHWIAISMKNGFARGNRLYPAHYGLLYFTKGEPAHFKRPRIDPLKCHECGETVKDYGGYTAIIKEKGINLSDVWDDPTSSDVWLDLSPVRHSTSKFRAANELPLKLTRRVVSISGTPNGLFVDPFAGSGSGVLAAAMEGMAFYACDIVVENCEVICERLDAYALEDLNAAQL